MQEYISTHNFSNYHAKLEENLQGELLSILDQERELWFAKSRKERLTLGERNTSYFHKSVIISRSSNRVRYLRDSVGNDITNPQEIRDHITLYFQKLFTSENVYCQKYLLSSKMSIDLGGLPPPDDIRASLFSMHPNKAPGPDGFHPGFFQQMWDIVEEDLYSKISEWFHARKIPGKFM